MWAELILKIGYMLQSNRFRVALLTLVADIVVLFGLELDADLAKHLSTLISSVGAMLIAALSFRDPTARQAAKVLVLFLLVGLSGCMRALQGPAFDHSVQTATIAARCRTPVSAGGYTESPCSPELQADVDAMAKDAENIDDLTHGEKPE